MNVWLYLMLLHDYSNNSSATFHDCSTGNVAWFSDRTKRGPGHNWSGTSTGTEPDMLEEVLGKDKHACHSGTNM